MNILRKSATVLQREYYTCVAKVKRMAGIESVRSKTLRESIREDALHDLIAEATNSELLSSWPLGEQIVFLDTIAPLTPEEKNLRVHALVYGLYRNALRAEASSL